MPDIIMNPPEGKGSRPEMPSTPPPEALSMKFDFDPKLLSGDDTTTIITDNGTKIETTPAEVKTEETKSSTSNTPEPKKEEKKSEAPEPKKSALTPPVTKESEVAPKKGGETEPPKIKQFTPVKEKKEGVEVDPIDYSKYSADEVKYLKQMSNESKKFVASKLDEAKELSKLKDASYLQHEEAYVLSPEYKSLQTKDYYAREEGRMWQEALLAIKAGKPYKQPVGIDPKSGKIILSDELNPSDVDEIRIQNNLGKCINAIDNVNSQLQTFTTQYKGRINQDLQTIKAVQKEKFAWHSDPKLMDYTIDVEGKGAQPVRVVREEFKNLFPPYLRSSPGVDVAADLMVSLMIQSAELKEALNSKKISEIKREEVARGEPTSDAVDNAPKKDPLNRHIPDTFSLAGLRV